MSRGFVLGGSVVALLLSACEARLTGPAVEQLKADVLARSATLEITGASAEALRQQILIPRNLDGGARAAATGALIAGYQSSVQCVEPAAAVALINSSPNDVSRGTPNSRDDAHRAATTGTTTGVKVVIAPSNDLQALAFIAGAFGGTITSFDTVYTYYCAAVQTVAVECVDSGGGPALTTTPHFDDHAGTASTTSFRDGEIDLSIDPTNKDNGKCQCKDFQHASKANAAYRAKFPGVDCIIDCRDPRIVNPDARFCSQNDSHGNNLAAVDIYEECGECKAIAKIAHDEDLGCVARGTEVLLADRTTKPVEQLVRGDRVWNPVKRRAYPVALVRPGTEYVGMRRVQLERSGLVVNRAHPFRTTRGMVSTFTLRVGDTVFDAKGHRQRVKDIAPALEGQPAQIWSVELEAPATDDDAHWMVTGGVVTGDLYLQRKLSSPVP